MNFNEYSAPSGLPKTGYVRLNQILQHVPIGRSTWWQWVRDGKAPQSVKLGARTTAWRAEEIHKLISELGE
jgi:predicted DNA-binding transcriptional regulator AlpA